MIAEEDSAANAVAGTGDLANHALENRLSGPLPRWSPARGPGYDYFRIPSLSISPRYRASSFPFT
jgi:hypothetical protein